MYMQSKTGDKTPCLIPLVIIKSLNKLHSTALVPNCECIGLVRVFQHVEEVNVSTASQILS